MEIAKITNEIIDSNCNGKCNLGRWLGWGFDFRNLYNWILALSMELQKVPEED